jgi:predicted nucleic acid-binding protein
MTENNGLIDSNILIYSLDTGEGNKHTVAKQFMRQRILNESGVVSIQNLAEFYSNVTEKITIPIPAHDARDAMQELNDSLHVIAYSPKTIARASFIQSAHRVHFWDALLVATMQENHILIIYTEDTKDFEKIPGIKAINPFEE